MSFSVFVENCVRPFRIGLVEQERAAPQPLRFTITATVDSQKPPTTFDATVDYYQIVLFIEKLSQREYVLLETLAQDLSDACFSLPHCRAVEIEIAKTALVAACTLGVRYVATRPH